MTIISPEEEDDDKEELERKIKELTGKVYDPNNGNTDEHKVKPRSTPKKKPTLTVTGDNEEGNKNKKAKNKERYVQKYHEGDLLAEAIIVGGKPCFAVAAPKVGNPDMVSVILQQSIQLDENTILKPFEFTSYINKPYIFKSKQEFEELVENTRSRNLDSIYIKVKSIWNKYIDADDFHISLCAADTIFSYFQDKIGLTHYLFFVGGNASGKTNNLTVLHFLAYRNMISSDITSANIFQFLGSGEEGIGTICEDEADNVDEDHDKMRIYKNGNTTGIPIFRTDTSFGRTQLRFNTFCFKAFAAERLPDSVKAKGFNQRIIELPCAYGFPQYDISEVANPAGEEKYEELLEELNTMRNILLTYRLLHFQSKIPDIKLNIDNREKQLFKPILRVFENTDTTLSELLPVISKYVSQRRESNANTLHAFLYRLITDLIKTQDTAELESALIWNTITNILPGDYIPNKKLSYDSSEFGVISQKGIIETLIQVFGAKPSQNRRENRKLVFDLAKLKRLSRIYELAIEVKVGTSSSVTDVTDVTDVGLDKHFEEQLEDKEIITSRQENTDINNKSPENNEKSTPEVVLNGREPSVDVSQASQASPNTITEPKSLLLPDQLFEYECYYCDKYKTNDEADYERHVINKHGLGHPCYPTKTDLERLQLKAHGKNWESTGI